MRNLLLAIISFVAIFVAFIFTGKYMYYSTVPDYEGEIIASDLEFQVSINRDSSGIPFITAESQKDAAFALGYLHAQERLFQMDLMRRAAEGRLSEIVGKKTVEIDKVFRTIGIKELANKVLSNASENEIDLLKSYSNGINYFVELNGNNLGIEFDLLDYKPDPWTPLNSYEIMKLLAWELNLSWWIKAAFIEASTKLTPTQLKDILPYKETWTNILELKKNITGKEDLEEFLSANLLAKDLLGFKSSQIGSNAWVVSSSKSKTGFTLLANDTHLALSLPDKWVFIVNNIEGKTLAGFTLPGLPVTVIGTNKKIAWGLTNLMADQCDFISVNKNEIKQSDIVEDTIRVKNDLPVGFKIFNTKFGPVINNRHLLDFLYGKSEVNKAIALKWTAAENHGELKAFINLNKAGNWSEFKSALKDFGSPAQNFLYADIDGNIGWHAAGAIPERKNPGQILYGNEFAGWNGFINFDKLPSEFNPSKGFIASANNKPDKLNYYITNFWEPEERFVRAKELLTITPESDTEFLMNMQKDIKSSYPKEFVEEILNAFSNVKIKDENLKVALDLLKEWDYTYSKYSQTSSIFEAFFNSLLKNTLADELGDTVLKKLSFISNVPLLVMKQLLRKNSVLWDNVKTAEIKESRYSIIRKSLVDAIYSLETEYGKDPAMWQWGRLHKITLKHPFHGVAELIDNNFDLGPHQLNGGHTTLYNTGYSFNEPYDANLGSAMRMIYDFSTPNQIYIIQPAGISGHPGSEFYNNFTKKWLNGDLIKVNLNEDSFLYSLTIKPY